MAEGQIMSLSSLFADLPQHLPDELITNLLEAANVHIERIVSHGHASPEGFWYDQDQHEWVLVLKGRSEAPVRGQDRGDEARRFHRHPGA